MSGSSRIGGSGTFGGYGGTGRREGRSASLERFKRNRKTGDVISGVFLRMETESLGWALLEGEELLAHLPAGVPTPRESEIVFFRVESLAPEVVLRMLAATDPLARLSLIVPPAPLSQEAALYIAARDKLDNLLASSGALPREGGGAAKEAFVRAVAESPVMSDAFAESFARSQALARAASPAGLVFFRHMPWLCPGMSSLEVSLWSGDGPPLFAGGVLPSGDKLLLRGSFENGSLRCRASVTPAVGGTETSGRYGGNEEGAADVVGLILARILRAGGAAVGRFSRTL